MRRIGHIIKGRGGWVLLVLGLLALNVLAGQWRFRWDLTREKRYTLSAATRDLLKRLEEPVEIDVFLTGEFPSGFRKLANSTRDFLGLLRDANSRRLRFRFLHPTDKIPGSDKPWGDSLTALGAIPINLTVQKEAGQSSNIIFPVALVSYQGKQSLVNLYPGASSRISQEEINSAEALMEYQFVKTLDRLTSPRRPGIAYHTGNGEPTDGRTFMLRTALSEDYRFGVLDLHEQPRVPEEVDVLLVVKPTVAFDEDEKLKLDQFVMRGGKLLCFIDNLIAEQDSLARQVETIAYDRNLNLTDLFFKYGLRINTDLVMDLQCDLLPFVVGGTAENPQTEFLRWNYYPVLNAAPGRLTRGLGYVAGRFVNSIDTIAAPGIRKEPLLLSSPNSRIISTPALISLNENRNLPEDAAFKRNAIPVAMLLEGVFPSLYRNRIGKASLDTLQARGTPFRDRSDDNKMIVVADGDIVLNEFVPSDDPTAGLQPIGMGYNKYTYFEYINQTPNGRLFIPVANREFLLNCVEYLVSNPAISETRNKDIVLRLLDAKKVKARKATWQWINLALPVGLVLVLGWLFRTLRRHRYARKA